MNSSNPIGGYFELELSKGSLLHDDVILLQSARSCLEYLINSLSVEKIYIPKYTCDVILQPIHKNNISYEFYSINNNLEIENTIEINQGEFLLYTNYFGLKDNYCDDLSNQYGQNLIIDCSQAYYYYNHKESHIIYSPRKFFGVPDGGELYTNKLLDIDLHQDISYDKSLHLLKRIDLGPESAYADFKNNDKQLDNQPVKLMSNLTRRILESIDYEKIANKRRLNYQHLETKLQKTSDIQLERNERAVPMCYPYVTSNYNLKAHLINNGIYIPNSCVGYYGYPHRK